MTCPKITVQPSATESCWNHSRQENWDAESRPKFQTFRASRCGESDSRSVGRDKVESDARPQSHMKEVFIGWAEVFLFFFFLPGAPPSLHRRHNRQHALLCLHHTFTPLSPSTTWSLILSETKQDLGYRDTLCNMLSLCAGCSQLFQTFCHPPPCASSLPFFLSTWIWLHGLRDSSHIVSPSSIEKNK